MKPIIRHLGLQPYLPTWQAMQTFTQQRHTHTPDELWIVEHPPTFTQGLAGKPEHILDPGNIPVIQTDRGGQATYHGPGQLIVYLLVDLKRNKWGIRHLVTMLEKTIVTFLAEYQINAHTLCKARGVYVEGAKICSIGLRVRKHCTYHGLALNVNLDLSPFLQINPCGYKGLRIVQMAHWIPSIETATVGKKLIPCLCKNLTMNI